MSENVIALLFNIDIPGRTSMSSCDPYPTVGIPRVVPRLGPATVEIARQATRATEAA